MDHIVRPEQMLLHLLDARQVLMHPFVAGEVLVGSLANRERIRKILFSLQQAPVLPDATVISNIEEWRAYNRGISYIDAHLLSSCVERTCLLWTRDKRLGKLTEAFRLRFAEL